MAEFVRPWADWTPEHALEAKAFLENREWKNDAERAKILRNLEGYWAEHNMERTLEQNAPLFSAKGAKRFVRYYFPKTLEAYDAKRPWWMTAMQVPRDVVTNPQRAGIYTAGSLANAGIWGMNTLLGTDIKPIDPETYDMSGTSAVQSDPSVALLAHPAGTPMKFVGALSRKGAETAGKFAASKLPSWAAKGAKAAGGFGGEVFGVSAIHNVSNLGEFTPEESAQMAVFGTGLSRGLGVVPKALGKGMQGGVKYLTRKKWSINRSDSEGSDLLNRVFGGEKLPKDLELLLLESGELGRGPIAAESVAGEKSAWAGRTGAKYEEVAAQQNARLDDALAIRPEVSVGEARNGNVQTIQRSELKIANEGKLPVVRQENQVVLPGEQSPVTNYTRSAGTEAPSSVQFRDKAVEFQEALRGTGILPSGIIVREGETTQIALARELNARDAYAKRARGIIYENKSRLSNMDALHDKMQGEANRLRVELEERANRLDEMPQNTKKEVAAYEREAAKLDKMYSEIQNLYEKADQLLVSRKSLSEQINRQEAELSSLEENLDRVAKMSNELGFGIVDIGTYENAVKSFFDNELEFVPGVTSEGTKEAIAASKELLGLFEDAARYKHWNRIGSGPNGSGRFIPAEKFRGMVSGVTKKHWKNARQDPVLATASQNASRSLRRVKNRIDREQSFGEIGENAGVESLRNAMYEALLHKQPTVDNANRLTIGNLYGTIQRTPLHDRALTKIYQFGTELVPRTSDQNTARLGLGLDPEPGGELGDALRAILAFGGREGAIIKTDYGRESPAQKAWDNIENFIASIEAAKQGEAK